MFRYLFIFIIYFFANLLASSVSFAEVVKNIEIRGNDRVSDQTIQMFSSISINDDIEISQINNILKRVYDTNFFDDVSIIFENNVLKINVKEKPVILNINYEGIKTNDLKDSISKNRILKPRASFDKISLKNDKDKIILTLMDAGYYFAKIEPVIEIFDDNKVNIIYQIDLGEKSKIKKISFIGNKVFKDKKLRSIIVSEEYKFWKFISGKKFLNKNLIQLDARLLKNFYLNRGYRNIEINSSFAKLINQNEFELIFNINTNKKIYFDLIDLDLPNDYTKDDFEELYDFFDSIKGKVYSVNTIEKIIKKIETVALDEQFESVKVSVIENFNLDKINLNFKIEDTEKFYVEKINIYGNNITLESVIRNQLLLDEGDPYNEILYTKSINQIKSLNFFKSTAGEILDGKNINNKIINITVEEKATGEIALGAGAGTSGATVGFAVKENNFLGKGISLNSSLTLTDQTIKGQFNVINPNFQNSDKSINFNVEALEIDRTKTFGYKTNKIGFSVGTAFEYFDDLNLAINLDNYYEKISTDGSASALQKTQDGNYWDTFLNLGFDQDKRNQKYDTNDGYRSFYSIGLPLISDTNTLANTYKYKIYTELYENNITKASFLIKTANSITGKNIKLSERLFIPSNSLRGFENGKIGPKDGNDFIGGNFITAANLSSNLPHILENYQNIDFSFFIDAGNVWGVDYSSSINDGSKIRSSIGLGIDWFTPIGPLNFSFAQPITKESTDITETFRFNLGTTF